MLTLSPSYHTQSVSLLDVNMYVLEDYASIILTKIGASEHHANKIGEFSNQISKMGTFLPEKYVVRAFAKCASPSANRKRF